MMKKCFLLLVLFLSIPAFSQSVNDYKYAIVPSKFEFLGEPDRFRLNALTKLMLEKYGFVVYLSSDDIPMEVLNQKCQSLFVEVQEKKSMFVTKLKVLLKDCKDRVVFETAFGESREKDFKVAYNEALRDCAKYFDVLHYRYNGKQDEVLVDRTAENSKVDSGLLVGDDTRTLFFAQPIQNGFQLMNSDSKMIFEIYKTSIKDCYIAVKEGLQGVFLLSNNQWFFEYYQNEKLVSEKVDVKF